MSKRSPKTKARKDARQRLIDRIYMYAKCGHLESISTETLKEIHRLIESEVEYPFEDD